MTEPEPQQPQDQHPADLAIGDIPAQLPAYTLDDFLPMLLTLLTPRKAVTSAPTFTPKTFVDSIQLYYDGSTYYLYLYIDNAWRSFPAGSAVTQLLAGAGIGLSPGGGTGIVTISNTGVKSIVAGTNVSISPGSGIGDVTINMTAPTAMTSKVVIATRGGADASGTQTIAHGLGRTPSYVRITAVMGTGTPWLLQSFGTYDGTNTRTVHTWTLVGSAGGADNDTSNIVFISTHGGDTQSAAVSGLDATNLTLNWTKVGSLGATTIHLLVETFA